jgi:Flp pilus assembly protein CpaB
MHGSTLFALTLALLAGLVGAYLFKTYFLNAKSPVAAAGPDGSVEIYLASANLTDNLAIQPNNLHRVKLTKEEYERFKAQESRLGPMLPGQFQAVGCVTKEKIKADEPIYESQVMRPDYPVPVSTRLRPGMRAVIVKVPADSAMVQVDDRVDLLCTISNPDFGLGQTATARLAKDAKVVARFNTTRAAALPLASDPNRTYTLEVTPYRHGLIEVAKTLGATFNLSVEFRPEKGKAGPMPVEIVPDADPDTDHVTSADLARIFGVTTHLGNAPNVLTVERFNGINQQNSLRFRAVEPTKGTPARPIAEVAPGGFVPLPPLPRTTGQPVPVTPAGSTSLDASSDSAMASDSAPSPNFGFRPPLGANPGCKTCGKK